MLQSNKRAVSPLIAYVLLISMGLALSVMVYGWLKGYINTGEELKCDEGVKLIIKEYDYNCNQNTLNITIQNKGRFSVEGYIIRVNNNSESDIAVYTLNQTQIRIDPGESYSETLPVIVSGTLNLIEVQPIAKTNGKNIICEQVSKQEISC